MLVLKNVCKSFADDEELLFEKISVSLEKGSFTGIIGPSGSGKSTLLRTINRLEPVDSGSIYFLGKNIEEYSVQDLRKQIGFVFQHSIMLDGTVKDNLLTGPHLHKQSVAGEKCRHTLQEVDLNPDIVEQDAQDLSGGQKQRIALLRTLFLQPKLLLLDEPTSALDKQSKRIVEQYVLKLNKEQGLTVLWVTHDLGQLRRIMDQYWFLSSGKLIEQGSVEQLFINPKHHLTRQFVGQEGEE